MFVIQNIKLFAINLIVITTMYAFKQLQHNYNIFVYIFPKSNKVIQ